MKELEFKNMNVICIGDSYGNFKYIFQWVKQKKINNTIIIITGNNGIGCNKENFIENLIDDYEKNLKKRNVYFLLIRGNYDDPFYYENDMINYEYIKTLPDYSIISIKNNQENNINILCIGGDISINRVNIIKRDKIREKYNNNYKKIYYNNESSYYDEEILNNINKNYKISYVITHNAPSFCKPHEIEYIYLLSEYDDKLKKDYYNERKVMNNIYNFLIKHGHNLKIWLYCCFNNITDITTYNDTDFKGLERFKGYNYEVLICDSNEPWLKNINNE